MRGVTLTPLRQVITSGGNIFHALKKSEESYVGFGEAYFTAVDHGVVKGWKRHRVMTMNLVAICGSVRFITYDDVTQLSQTYDLSAEVESLYARLTVAPGLWMAFGGLGPNFNLVLNVADIEHDFSEAERAPVDRYPWTWPL